MAEESLSLQEYVSVIGGINLDIKGEPERALMMGTSNPGRIFRSPGGVGRNIAHNLALLGVPVRLFSVVGDDQSGREILDITQHAGVCVEAVSVVQGQRTGTYLSLLDQTRDLAAAISDMEIIRQIDMEYLALHRDVIRNSRFVVLEANLGAEALRYAVEMCRQEQIPCLVEPVSSEKVKRLLHVKGQIDFLTPNVKELESFAASLPVDLPSGENQQETIERLSARMGKYCRHLLVTHGDKGVFHYQADRQAGEWHKPWPVKVVDANGAGDAFVAGFVSGLFFHYAMNHCLRLGMAAAYFTLQSPETVDSTISFTRCLSRL